MAAQGLSRRTLLAATASAGLARGASPVRLLVVTGGHEFGESFWSVFENRKEWKMERRAHEPAVTCTVYDRPIAPDFDTVLLYDMPRDITEAQQRNFLALFERGVGVVVLHHALVGLQQWPTFEEIKGLRMRKSGEGALPAYVYQHDVHFDLQRVELKHPVLEGVPSFGVLDETYGRMYYLPGIQPLMVTNEPTSIPVLAWTRTYQNSRLVMIQPGHGPQIFAEPAFRRLIANSIQWVARRE